MIYTISKLYDPSFGERPLYARVVDQVGREHTIPQDRIPEDAAVGDEYAFQVNIWAGLQQRSDKTGRMRGDE